MHKAYSYLKISLLSVVLLLIATEISQAKSFDVSQTDTLLKDVTPGQLKDIIRSYEGKKAVLINVWATWCVPCVEEFPEIVKLQRAYPDQLQVIFISADFSDKRDSALKFLRERDVDWTTYFKTGSDQPFIDAISEEWTGALPFSKIIATDGSVIGSWEQKAGYDKFERYVKKAIDQ